MLSIKAQSDKEQKDLSLKKEKLPNYLEKDSFHVDSTRMLSFGWYYFQIGAVANTIPRAIFLTTDTHWRDHWTGRRDFTMSVLGFSYPFASALVYSRIFRNTPITPADANMFAVNSLTGILHGSFISDLVLEPQPIFNDLPGHHFILAGASLVEGWASFWISRRKNFTYTQSMAFNTGNFWGGYLGRGVGNLFSIEAAASPNTRVGAIGGLLGSGMGIFLTSFLHKKYPRTVGDYRAINSAALGIGLYSEGLFRRPSATSVNAYSTRELTIRKAAVTTFQLAALSAAFYITHRSRFTSEEGFLISGFASMGALLGALRYQDVEEIRDPFALPNHELAAGVGTIIGWCVGTGIVKIMRQPRYIKRKRTSWIPELQIQPSGLAFMRLTSDQQVQLMSQNLQCTLIQMTWKW